MRASPLSSIALSAALALGCACGLGAREGHLEKGDAVPAIAPSGNGSGKPIFESGRAHLVLFVRSSSRYSVSELEDLAPMLDKLNAGGAKLRTVVVVPPSEPKEGPVGRWAAARPTVELVRDEGRYVHRAFGVMAHPSSFVVAADGKIVLARRGPGADVVDQIEDAARFALGLRAAKGAEGSAASKPPHHDPAQMKRRRLVHLAEKLAKKRRWTQALAIFARVVREDPKSWRAHLGRGQALRALGKPAEALVALRLAYGLAKTKKAVEVELASVLIAAGKLEEAAPIVKAALVLNPKPSRAYLALGDLESKRGNWKAAAEAYRRAATKALAGR